MALDLAAEKTCEVCRGTGMFEGWDAEEPCAACASNRLLTQSRDAHRTLVRLALKTTYAKVATASSVQARSSARNPAKLSVQETVASAAQSAAEAAVQAAQTAAHSAGQFSKRISGKAALEAAQTAANSAAEASKRIGAKIQERMEASKSASDAVSSKPVVEVPREVQTATEGESTVPSPAALNETQATEPGEPAYGLLQCSRAGSTVSASKSKGARSNSSKQLVSAASYKSQGTESKKPLLGSQESQSTRDLHGSSKDLEAQESEEMQSVSWPRRMYGFAMCGSHLSHITMMVWVCIQWSTWSPVPCAATVSLQCAFDNLDFIKSWATIGLVPFVLYETIQHWYKGTYFPMTYSDSFHEFYYGKTVDMTPSSVRRGTLLAMILMGIFLSALSAGNFLTIFFQLCYVNPSATCEAEYAALSSEMKLLLWGQVFLYAGSLLLQAKSLALIAIFTAAGTVGFTLLGVLTLGIAWYIVCMAFSNGGLRRRREDESCSKMVNWAYDFIAWFYVRV